MVAETPPEGVQPIRVVAVTRTLTGVPAEACPVESCDLCPYRDGCSRGQGEKKH
jgi:hypothetical protein